MMRKRILSTVLSVCLVMSMFIAMPMTVSAATKYYNTYSDVVKIPDTGSCTAMQGMAVGSTYLYAVKIKSDETSAIITKTNKNTGSMSVMTNTATGTKYISTIGHANGIDVCSIDGYSNLFIATMKSDSSAVVRVKVDGTKYTQVGKFALKYDGANKSASDVAVYKKDDTNVTLLVKSGQTFYTGKVGVNATSGTINLTKVFTIDKSAVKINGSTVNATNFVNQGCGYHNQRIFVPMWSNTNSSQSIVVVYRLGENPSGKLTSHPDLSFRITSSSYSTFEIEDCGISSDGKLYFNTNRSGSADAIHYFKDFVSKSYEVKYDANGGTGSMTNTLVNHGDSTSLRSLAFSKTGYKFTGWQATRKSDGKWLYSNNGTDKTWYAKGSQPSGYTLHSYANGGTVSAQSSVDGDVVTLYAQWSPIVYTVKYNANGGTGTMADTSVTYGKSTPLRANSFAKTGHTFAGWNVHRASDNTWCYTNGTTKKWCAEGKQPSGYELYAYDSNASVSGQTTVNGDTITAYAKWTPHTYTVKYNANGGVGEMESTAVTYGVATPLRTNSFTKTGHTFAGWYVHRAYDNTWCYTNGDTKKWCAEGTQPSGYELYSYDNNAYVSGQSAVNGDTITAYAKWVQNTYTVKYNANGGEGTMNEQAVVYDGTVAVSANEFTRKYYNFVGFNAQRSSDGKWYCVNTADATDVKWLAEEEITDNYAKQVFNGGEELKNLTDIADDTITMNATWEFTMELGDVNLDGRINISDATYLQKAIAFEYSLSAEHLVVADVNGDGVISILDVTEIQKQIVGEE